MPICSASCGTLLDLTLTGRLTGNQSKTAIFCVASWQSRVPVVCQISEWADPQDQPVAANSSPAPEELIQNQLFRSGH
jgi:hypothetical protein